MPMDELREIAINELLASPAGEWLNKAMDTVSFVKNPGLDELLATHEETMARTRERIENGSIN